MEPFGPDGSPRRRIYFANHTSNLDVAGDLGVAADRAAPQHPAGRGPRLLGGRADPSIPVAEGVSRGADRTKEGLGALEPAGGHGSRAWRRETRSSFFRKARAADDDDGGVHDFKPGLWHLARKHPDVELVPVYLENLNRILPKGDFLLIPLLAAVTFGSPIRPEEGEEKSAFLERASAVSSGWPAQGRSGRDDCRRPSRR